MYELSFYPIAMNLWRWEIRRGGALLRCGMAPTRVAAETAGTAGSQARSPKSRLDSSNAEKGEPMRFARIFVRFSMSIAILFAVASAPSRAQETNESYYMTIFSAQANSRDPRRTHSFATFVKAAGTGDSAKDSPIEIHTISWMPQSFEIVILRRRPEPGVNLDLESSLRWAASKNLRVSMWGPYQINKELYDRAVEQETRLNSGLVLYKAIDRRFRPGTASNCIHAVADLDMDNGLLHSGQGRGDAASRQVAQHLNRWIINPEQTHTWVAGRLGLKGQPVYRADQVEESLVDSRSRGQAGE